MTKYNKVSERLEGEGKWAPLDFNDLFLTCPCGSVLEGDADLCVKCQELEKQNLAKVNGGP